MKKATATIILALLIIAGVLGVLHKARRPKFQSCADLAGSLQYSFYNDYARNDLTVKVEKQNKNTLRFYSGAMNDAFVSKMISDAYVVNQAREAGCTALLFQRPGVLVNRYNPVDEAMEPDPKALLDVTWGYDITPKGVRRIM